MATTHRRTRGGRLLGLVTLALALVTPARVALAEPAAPRLAWRELADRQRRESVVLLAAKHRLAQARADVIAAGVWSNPNVSASALLFTHGAVTGGNQELALSVDQTVPIAGQVRLRQDVARGFATAEERSFAAAAWQLASDGRAAYLDLQRAQARVRLVEVGLADLARVETVVTERTAGGAGTTYDKVRVGIERSKVEARLAQARVELVAARASLALLVGKSVDAAALAVEDAIPEAPATLPTEEELVRRALTQRPEIASADARVSASELRVSLQRRQVIPSPTLSLGYARYFDVPDAAGASGGAVLAGLSLPVPLLDRGQGRVDRSLAEAAEQRALREGAALSVRREVEQAVATVRVRADACVGVGGLLRGRGVGGGLSVGGLVLLALARVRVRAEAARRFRELTAPDLPRLRTIAELAYREGRATILELLDAYASHLDAEDRRLELGAGAARAVLDLERALGPTAGAR